VFIENPARESYKEIREKYNGYCVLVVECDIEKPNFGFGKVIAYNKNLADLTRETIALLDGDVGIFIYSTFTDFGNLSPIQVIHHV
jgi:hypothetical protein